MNSEIEKLQVACTLVVRSLSEYEVKVAPSRYTNGQVVAFLMRGTYIEREIVITPLTGFRNDLYQYQTVGVPGEGPIGSLTAPFIVGLLLASV